MSFARFTPSEDRALKECFKKKFSLSRDSEIFSSFLYLEITIDTLGEGQSHRIQWLLASQRRNKLHLRVSNPLCTQTQEHQAQYRHPLYTK